MREITKFELVLLMALLFVLPSFEGPRNVLLVVYLISWCVLGWKKKQYGGRVKIWECALGLFLVSGIVSSFSNPFGWEAPVSGVLTFAKLILPVFCLSRTIVTQRETELLAYSIILGTIVAVLYSWYVWFPDPVTGAPELKSVGHQNQSALYVSLAFGVASVMALTSKGWQRIIFLDVWLFLPWLP